MWEAITLPMLVVVTTAIHEIIFLQAFTFTSHSHFAFVSRRRLINANFFFFLSGSCLWSCPGPRGITRDGFAITQLQRSRGDRSLAVIETHWFGDSSRGDTFAFGERDGWWCGGVLSIAFSSPPMIHWWPQSPLISGRFPLLSACHCSGHWNFAPSAL